ncbi:DUF2842 domain-containing protein [Parasphingorhabdus halotolerans]|uniref:DUF2842 domain-containing protein n=1 Tax=Parasphingorhabdus halotolerans TaxID=2725558 RepID=A0A6H2DIA3_9SPHN|nr:DUF2842 domain-containing protein [Parasphingorhabdus halotolerans]QJB68064.1 DUF2842 domain-containing protein [Parasphingorhabdus halotolerans]
MTANSDNKKPDQPSWRKPVGMLFIVFLILLWCGISVTFIDEISQLNFWLQLPIYIILGIAWIFPVKPLLLWMNTGKFRQ